MMIVAMFNEFDRSVGDGKNILMTSALVLQLLQCPLADVAAVEGADLPTKLQSAYIGAELIAKTFATIVFDR